MILCHFIGKKTFFFLSMTSLLLAARPVHSDTAYHVTDVMCASERPDYKKESLIIENIGNDGAIITKKFALYEKNSDGLRNIAAEEVTQTGKTGAKILALEKSPSKTEITVNEPGMKSPKKLSSSDMKKSAFGTTFLFNLLKKQSPDDDNHEMISEKEKININSKSYSCWKIKSVPISKTVVDYSYRITWIEKETHLPVLIQFYSESKKTGTVLLRTFRIEELGSVTSTTGKSYDVWKRCSMKDETSGNITNIHADDFLFGNFIPESIFTSSWIGNKNN